MAGPDRDSLTDIPGLAFLVLYGGLVSCYLPGGPYFRFADTCTWLEPEDE